MKTDNLHNIKFLERLVRLGISLLATIVGGIIMVVIVAGVCAVVSFFLMWMETQ